MTVVYPITIQSDYTELRYSLRSIEKYLKFDEVVIVGDYIPDWLNNVTQIHIPDVQGQNNYSVRRKVIAALHYISKRYQRGIKEVSKTDFLFMNDDFYLLKPVKNDFPYYSSGTLEGKAEAGARPLLKRLKDLNKPTKYYGHYPALYRKDFTEIINNFPNECITKSAYLNFIEPESIEISDCKILTAKKESFVREFIKDRPCFSTGMYSINSAIPVLNELFPKPSIFEI